eukprot:6199613-Pleurochrysis_carterae.AAC.1
MSLPVSPAAVLGSHAASRGSHAASPDSLAHPWITAKAWLMSCGDNPEANMASNNNTNKPDAGRRESAGPSLSALVGELALLVHAAAIGEEHNADRMSALATALQRETVCERVEGPLLLQLHPPRSGPSLRHAQRQSLHPLPPPLLHRSQPVRSSQPTAASATIASSP